MERKALPAIRPHTDESESYVLRCSSVTSPRWGEVKSTCLNHIGVCSSRKFR